MVKNCGKETWSVLVQSVVKRGQLTIGNLCLQLLPLLDVTIAIGYRWALDMVGGDGQQLAKGDV